MNSNYISYVFCNNKYFFFLRYHFPKIFARLQITKYESIISAIIIYFAESTYVLLQNFSVNGSNLFSLFFTIMYMIKKKVPIKFFLLLLRNNRKYFFRIKPMWKWVVKLKITRTTAEWRSGSVLGP